MLNNKFYKSTGILIYSDNPFKLIVKIDKDISYYYKSLIPKYFRANPQKYEPHISVVRKETPNINFWNLYKNKEINFLYENIIYNDEAYFWLNVYSKELENIRLELGLQNTSEITKSPDGKHKFHITIANFKN